MKPAERDHAFGAAIAATQQRAQPGRQLAKVEGLAEVIVRPAIEPVDPIGHHIACGQEQDRRRDAGAAPLPEQIEARAIRQADVEDYSGMVGTGRYGPGIGAVGHRVDLEAVEAQTG